MLQKEIIVLLEGIGLFLSGNLYPREDNTYYQKRLIEISFEFHNYSSFKLRSKKYLLM